MELHLMSFKALSLPLLFLSILLASCSGNESSLISNPDSALSVVTGVVHSGRANNIEVQGVAAALNDKLTLDAEAVLLGGVRAITDERGRFTLGLDSENTSAVVMFARGIESNENSTIRCKLPQGCRVKQGKSGELILVASGEPYSPAYYFDYSANTSIDDNLETHDEFVTEDTTLWSVGLEFTAPSQFVSINCITGIVSAFGLSTYVNGSGQCDADKCDANNQAAGYFSKYGIVKANAQLANLLGLSDIISKESSKIAALGRLFLRILSRDLSMAVGK
jgi:hypothetical protein